MIIAYFVQFEPRLANVVDVICVLDVVTDLVVKYACRINKANICIRVKTCISFANRPYRTGDKWMGSPIICESR